MQTTGLQSHSLDLGKTNGKGRFKNPKVRLQFLHIDAEVTGGGGGTMDLDRLPKNKQGTDRLLPVDIGLSQEEISITALLSD